MKLLPLLCVSLLIASFFVPCLSVNAQPKLVPHEDPAGAQNTLDSYSFLMQYAEIFALMSTQDYSNASRLSEELSHITVPAELSYIVNRYNNLTQQLINVLNDLQTSLNDASSLLDQGRLDEAGQVLDHAGFLVAQAQILLGDLQDATLTLSHSFGVLASSAESKVRQAYNKLQSILNQLNDLIDRYHALLQQTTERATQIKSQNLKPVTLSLMLNSTECFVGGYVGASGALSSKGQALPNRVVELLLDGNQVATVTTTADGTYYSVFRIPYNYVDSVSVSAIYTPVGNEKSVYLAALSPTVKVQVLFYKTTLNVSVASVGYPGLSLSIRGNTTSNGGVPLDKRQISVLLDDEVVTQTLTNQSGFFSAEVTINSNATLGAQPLKISAAPSGIYAGSSVQKTLTIEKIRSNVKVNVASFVVLPSHFQISGTVNSASSPLKGATVAVVFANITDTVRTSEDGSFNFTLDLPLNSFLAGYQDLNVKTQPSEPWQATAQTKVSVFILNSVNIGTVLATLLSVGFVAYFKFAKTKRNKTQAKAEAQPVLFSRGSEAGPVVSSGPEFRYEGTKGAVLKAYAEGLGAIKLATGEFLRPNMTLREYMQKTGAKIGKATEPFCELTVLAERCLYSPHEPEESELEKARGLADEIGRILNIAGT